MLSVTNEIFRDQAPFSGRRCIVHVLSAARIRGHQLASGRTNRNDRVGRWRSFTVTDYQGQILKTEKKVNSRAARKRARPR